MSDRSRSTRVLPHRPRLSEDGMLRRHWVDGEEKLVLHDGFSEEIIELSAAQLEQLLCCDGTRDLGGILLACSRAGVYHRASDVEAMLAELHARGLIADGIAASPPEPLPSARPLHVLPDFWLRCDGHGGCCSTYSSIAFSRDDVRTALRVIPDADDRLFLPLYGSAWSSDFSVGMRDGACAFLAGDGRCRIHQAAGKEAKPRGCQGFPAVCVDDGAVVRVSAAVECACVLRSVAEPTPTGEGAPLTVAETTADLHPGTPIARLPEALPITPARSEACERLAAWSDAVVAAPVQDAVSAFWALSDAVSAHGLDAAAALRALETASPPPPGALGEWLLCLAGKTADKHATSRAWRAEADRTRRLSAWLDDAARSLTDLSHIAARLQDAASSRWQEAFYFRSTLWGHQLAGRLPLAQALRDRAVRLLLARQCARQIPAASAADPAAQHPITAVEAMMRGQGLDGYAVGLT